MAFSSGACPALDAGWIPVREKKTRQKIENVGGCMPSRARLDEFIAVVVSGDHAGAIERYYTEDASMQENTAPPRAGRDVLVAHERAALERVKSVTSTCVTSIVEGDRVAINWVFEFIDHAGKTTRFDEVALQEWRGDRIFHERFFYDPSKLRA
jgi:ketosteroid isomerase-like protein